MNNYKNKLGVGITIGTGTSNWETIAKQIDLVEQHKLDFAELSVFDWNIICGTKIVDPEIKKLIKICNGRSIGFTVHGELTVNFFDYENIELHKEILSIQQLVERKEYYQAILKYKDVSKNTALFEILGKSK